MVTKVQRPGGHHEVGLTVDPRFYREPVILVSRAESRYPIPRYPDLRYQLPAHVITVTSVGRSNSRRLWDDSDGWFSASCSTVHRCPDLWSGFNSSGSGDDVDLGGGRGFRAGGADQHVTEGKAGEFTGVFSLNLAGQPLRLPRPLAKIESCARLDFTNE